MYTTFQLTTEELNNDFLLGVKKLFKGRRITLTINDELGEETLNPEQQDWINGLKDALNQAKLFEEGKITLRPARELLNEL